MKTIKIAVDGPSGAGKSTLAREVAKKIGCIYIDTGALYRTIGLYVLRRGISPTDTEAVIAVLPELDISLRHIDGVQHVFSNGNDVSEKIRTQEVSAAASAVSAIPDVRRFLFGLQRSIAESENVIMDGRDIGTVILPDADVKIFLTASPESRAKRRYKELAEKNPDVSYDYVLSGIIRRDKNDSERTEAPLKPAADAVLLDNSDITLEQTVDETIKIIGNKINV